MTGTHLERESAASPQRVSDSQYVDEQNSPASRTKPLRRDRAKGRYAPSSVRTELVSPSQPFQR
ncbi:hypothetical protein D3C81_226140 [compost metagenome]|jgi:hypothetical protein